MPLVLGEENNAFEHTVGWKRELVVHQVNELLWDGVGGTMQPWRVCRTAVPNRHDL